MEDAMDQYRVTLTTEERADLERLVSVGTGAARRLTHARILLLADTATGGRHSDDEIVAALGVGIGTSGRVRRRWSLPVAQRLGTPDRSRSGRTRSRSRETSNGG